MPKHELYVSAPGYGKTFTCIEQFREEILKSPSGIDSQSFFVLPNREHAGRIQHLLLKKDAAGLFNAHILTFHELTQKMLSGVMPPRPTQALRSHLVSAILQDPALQWSYFEPVKDLKGFQDRITETIQEFKSSLLSIEDFEKRAQPLLKDPVFRAKFRDLSILVKRYEAALADMGLADTEDALRKLLPTEPPAARIGMVVLDGFYHFTRAQRAVIQYLAPHTDKMIVTLTLPANARSRADVFGYGENTRRFLLDLGFEPPKKAFSQNTRTQDAALRHLEENIFLDAPTVFQGPTRSIQMIAADHVHDETEMIARTIRDCHRDKNVHFSDIAVILRSVQPYQKRLSAAFKDYEIPFFMHERGKMIDNSALRFVHMFLGLLSPEWETQVMIPLLGSVCLQPTADEREMVEFQRRLLRDRVSPDPDSWQVWMQAQVDLMSLQTRFEHLMQARSSLLGCTSSVEFRMRLERELRRMGWEDSLTDADRAAHRAFQDLCKQWEVYSASPTAMPDHLRRGIELGLYSEKPSGKNRVQIYDTIMALPKEYKIVFLAGLLEKQFPKEINEDAIFKDDERRQLNANDWILEERLPRTGGERFFFYMALTRAREQLYLTFPLKDVEGKPRMTSFFVDEVRKCFPADALKTWTSHAWKATSGWVSTAEGEKRLAHHLFSETLPEPALQEDVLGLATAWSDNSRFARVIEAGRVSGRAEFLDPRIPDLIGQNPSVFSATKLESYLTCAFKYHADYTLRLKESLDNRERIEMGIIIHEVLEKHWKEGSGEADHWRALLDDAFNKSSLSSEPAYRKNMYREKISQILARFMETESQRLKARPFEPRYFELAFGKKPGSLPGTLDFLTWGDIRLEGKIDRVDVREAGTEALITDYKLSKKPLWEKLNKGLEVQLPIYAMAVEELLGLKVVGAELRFLEEEDDIAAGLYQDKAREQLGLGPKKRVLSADEWDDIMTTTKNNVTTAVKRLRSGDIRIRSKSCQFCSYGPVCRFEKWRLIYDEVDGG